MTSLCQFMQFNISVDNPAFMFKVNHESIKPQIMYNIAITNDTNQVHSNIAKVGKLVATSRALSLCVFG